MGLKIELDLSDELMAALETCAKREYRTVHNFIEKTLQEEMFGHGVVMTDAEWAAYKAESALEPPKTPRVSITAKQRNRIFERCDGKCSYCSGLLLYNQTFHIDHIVPLAKGGTNDEANLTLSCAACNVRKHTKLVASQ